MPGVRFSSRALSYPGGSVETTMSYAQTLLDLVKILEFPQAQQLVKFLTELKEAHPELDLEIPEAPRLRIRGVVQTCSACPSQWEALTEDTEDSKFVYIRYRHSYLSIEVDDVLWYGQTHPEEPYDGCITLDRVCELTGLMVLPPKETS